MGKLNQFSKQPLNHVEKLEKDALKQNRRIKGNRLDISFPVYITSKTGELIQGYAESINLSWSGILLETNILLENGDDTRLEFTLPETDNTLIIKSKVVRVQGQKDVEYHIVGFIFKEMDVNSRRMLNGYILERLDNF